MHSFHRQLAAGMRAAAGGGGTAFLDLYPGAVGAFSLRDLSGLGQDVVLVTRVNDLQQQAFNAAEVSDGTLTTWVGAGNNAVVTTWYDQSGNDNHYTQGTLLDRPRIVDNGALITDGGSSGIHFGDNGGGDRSLTGAQLFSGASAHTILAVVGAIAEGATASNTVFDVNQSFTGSSGLTLRLNLESTLINRVSGTVWVPYSSNTKSAISLIYPSGAPNISNYQFRQNNSALTPVTASGAFSMNIENTGTGRIGLSTGASLDGLLMELIVYPSDQSASIVNMELNQLSEYGITP
jgi:hypothetical protein